MLSMVVIEPRGGLIGALELEQQRHLLVEVDAGDLGQRVGGALAAASPCSRHRRLRTCAPPAARHRGRREARRASREATSSRRGIEGLLRAELVDAAAPAAREKPAAPVGCRRRRDRRVAMPPSRSRVAIAALAGSTLALTVIEPARPDEQRAGGGHGRRAGIGEEAGRVGQRRRGALVALGEHLDQAARDLVELALIGDGDVVADGGEAGQAARPGQHRAGAAGDRHAVDVDGVAGRAGA